MGVGRQWVKITIETIGYLLMLVVHHIIYVVYAQLLIEYG